MGDEKNAKKEKAEVAGILPLGGKRKYKGAHSAENKTASATTDTSSATAKQTKSKKKETHNSSEENSQVVNPYVLSLASTQASTQTDTQTDDEVAAQLAYENLTRHRAEKKRKKRRRIIGVIAALLVAGVAWFVTHPPQSDDVVPMLPTSVAYRGEFSDEIISNGATTPLSETVVTPEVDGIIQEVMVSEGQAVAAGETLFTLKNDDLDKAIREAEQNVERAQKTLNVADRDRNNAYAAYDEAWVACNNIGDFSSFDEAGLTAAIDSANSAYDDAYIALQAAKETLDEAIATGDKRTVVAPVSGTIITMNAVSGAAVGGATGGTSQATSGSLITIADLSQMQVTVQVNEIDISNIEEGQEGLATFSALPGVELPCTVKRIASTSASEGGDYGGGGIVTYAVNLIIPEPDPDLKPGMTASVTIRTQHVDDAIIVPVAALNDMGDGHYTVSVVIDEETQETEERNVEVIAQSSAEAAVKGDIDEGDIVLMGSVGIDEDIYFEEGWSLSVG